jgi:GTP-binding protein HflX
MSNLSGNLAGLKPLQLKKIQKISQRRVQPESIISHDFARLLCEISLDIQRQIGVLVNRAGYTEYIIVGDSHKIFLPDLKRTRIGGKRFRGLRLLHTHLKEDEKLSHDDLVDLALLRLDLVAAITFDSAGIPKYLYLAHLLPENKNDELWRIFPPIQPSLLNENFSQMITALEEEFSRESRLRSHRLNKNRALLIGVYSKDDHLSQNRMQELKQLSNTAGINVLGFIRQIRNSPDPKFYIGKGKLQETVLKSLQSDTEMLIFDNELTPTQAKSLSDFTDLKILDRTQLILDIFAQHATSRDGKLQVELAQLKYLKSRLSEKDDNMSRLTGGIGGRGPGETKLEIGKRRVQEKITRLENEIKKLRSIRDLRRQKRKKMQIPLVSIIGYTNAGKSTLLNALTNAKVIAEDKLFATLDPTTRRVRFPEEREIILSDTVGFIQDLPPTLLNAFMATLEELHDADLLVHVIDIAAPLIENQIQTIEGLLAKLNLEQIPKIYAYNQCDKLNPADLSQKINFLESKNLLDPEKTIYISAKKLENIPALTTLIERNLWQKNS